MSWIFKVSVSGLRLAARGEISRFSIHSGVQYMMRFKPTVACDLAFIQVYNT